MIGRTFRVAAALIVCIGPPSLATAQNADAPGLQRAIAAQERHTNSLLSVPGVVGTGVGTTSDGRPLVKIFTRARNVPGMPRTLDGIPVRVEAIGRVVALRNICSGPPWERPPECDDDGGDGDDTSDPTARFERPVPIGVSTGHPKITAGTICCRVVNRAGDVFALSNNHVYADENTGMLGSDNVLQPGPYDGGSDPDDAIGVLWEAEPIVFSTSHDNVVDAAIALSSTSDVGNSTPANGYGKPLSGPVAAVPGMNVMKYGRTTAQTTGTVDSINVIVHVAYDSGTARFVDQIAIKAGGFSKGGDSGSLVVVADGENARRPVGLLFAGGRGLTFANPFGDVLVAFDATIDDAE